MTQPVAVSTFFLWLMVAVGYVLGSIPFGYLLVRARSGRDVRVNGSGNIGATNVTRTEGLAAGIATLVLDAAKGLLAVILAAHFSGGNIRFMLYAGLAAILGHMFPVWLKFSGGKGVATALGVFAVVCAPAVGVAAIVFLLVFVFWHYVSLAALSAAAALPLLVYILYAPGHAPPVVVSAGTLLAAVLVIVKHRANIERLMDGSEPRFDVGRKES